MAVSISDNDSTITPSLSAPAMVPVVAGLPVLAALWALLSPDRLLSREMTWDLLFNLAGAWHVFQGQLPHVDFHEPVGELNFLLTAAGFHLVGLSPRAFLVGQGLMALLLFAFASIAATRRLPPLPAILFVLFTSLLALSPANVGDLPAAYSFAMSYNRYGWSALSIVALILFLPPGGGRVGALDAAIVAVLLLALFYTKVTYFAAGTATLALAVVVSPAIRAHWKSWTAIGIALAANALAPYSHPYLADLFAAAGSGVVRDNYVLQINYFLSNGPEHALYLGLAGAALWLWWQGKAPLGLAAAAVFLTVVGWLLLSQNSQTHGMPLCIVVALLLYDVLRRHGSVALASLLLALPLMSIANSAASIAGYHFKTGDPALRVVDTTNLKGLAVPAEESGLLAAFAASTTGYALLNRARAPRPRYELSPYEYVETILEAANLLSAPEYLRGPVILLDQVNPLPFMLGLPPPTGGNLWSGAGAPFRPAEQFFAGVDHVLIPKFSTFSKWTEAAAAHYGSYLADHFRHLKESQSWLLLSRNRAVSAPAVRDGGGLAEQHDER